MRAPSFPASCWPDSTPSMSSSCTDFPEGGPGPAARRRRLSRTGRQPRAALARRPRDRQRRLRLVHDARIPQPRRRLCGADHVLRHLVRVSWRSRTGCSDTVTGFRFLSAHGAADHLRDGAAALADLPRARHHLHRRRDADRGRRDGRGRRHPPRRGQAPAHLGSRCARPRNRPPSCPPSWSSF